MTFSPRNIQLRDYSIGGQVFNQKLINDRETVVD